MRYLIYLIFSAIPLMGASISLNEARDQNSSFSILHIVNNSPFACDVETKNDFSKIIKCSFETAITPIINRSNTDLAIKSYKNILTIKPSSMFQLQGLQDDFITSDIIKTTHKKVYNHWVMIGYKKEIDMLRSNQNVGLDFDITYSENFYPSVGTLSIDGLPVVNISDAKIMSRIKKRYNEKNYEQAIMLIDQMSEDDAIYKEEATLYKLRSLDKLAWSDKGNKIDNEDIVELAKRWIEDNPSSKNIPEVLMYIAKTYYKLGYTKMADEFSKILNDEFYESIYNLIAKVYQADRLYENRSKQKEAITLYQEVLYNTKDYDLASKVAIILSDVYMNKGDVDEAYSYYKKVLDANKEYLSKDIKKSYEIAKKFADLGKYKIAIEIVGNMLSLKNIGDLKEDMFKNFAYWYDTKNDKNIAYGLYKQYQKDYKDGKHEEFVQSRIDKILIDIDENNITKKIAYLDNVMKKYPNDDVYKKALLKKAKILVLEDRFEEFFSLRDELEANSGGDILKAGALKKVALDLKNDRCKSAIGLVDDYNITIQPQNDKKYFECLVRLAKYKKALNISQQNMKTEDLKKKIEWMYKTLNVYSKLGNYNVVISLAQDIEKLSKVLRINIYDDICYAKALAYYNLKDSDDLMLNEANIAQKIFPNDIRNIDLFSKVLRNAKKARDDLKVQNYAKKIIDLQKHYKIDDYSPMVEIDYIYALKSLKQYDKALKENLKLLYVRLTDKQKANVLYIAGDLSLKLERKKDAKEFFTKCGVIVDDNPWQKLCAESLELFE